ncbi:MAG TPA: response regulator [Longimicrobiales bacterium]|nr:response regulator [Longimicrobiales bacterium]
MEAARAPRNGTERGVHRPLVLVIEDNLHHCEIYGRMLCYNGYDVIHAGDGEAGLRLARERLPDLVLLDLTIPGIDGLDVCRLLKADSTTSGIHVVVLSSRERSRWEDAAREAGADEYLEKPVNAVDVLHTVEQIVGRAPLPGTGRPPLFSTVSADASPDAMQEVVRG